MRCAYESLSFLAFTKTLGETHSSREQTVSPFPTWTIASHDVVWLLPSVPKMSRIGDDPIARLRYSARNSVRELWMAATGS